MENFREQILKTKKLCNDELMKRKKVYWEKVHKISWKQ